MQRNRWPHVDEGERVVEMSTPLSELRAGDLIGYRMAPYGDGLNQHLFVVVIDGYGTEVPVTWKVYTKLEVEPVVVDWNGDFSDPSNYRVRINTFSNVRDYGAKLSKSEAVDLFPWLAELPYDR